MEVMMKERLNVKGVDIDIESLELQRFCHEIVAKVDLKNFLDASYIDKNYHNQADFLAGLRDSLFRMLLSNILGVYRKDFTERQYPGGLSSGIRMTLVAMNLYPELSAYDPEIANSLLKLGSK
jgi:hypothetical protein